MYKSIYVVIWVFTTRSLAKQVFTQSSSMNNLAGYHTQADMKRLLNYQTDVMFMRLLDVTGYLRWEILIQKQCTMQIIKTFNFFITRSYFIYDQMCSVRLGNYFLSGGGGGVEVGCVGKGLNIWFTNSKCYFTWHNTCSCDCENQGPCTMIEFQIFFTPAYEQEKVFLYVCSYS